MTIQELKQHWLPIVDGRYALCRDIAFTERRYWYIKFVIQDTHSALFFSDAAICVQ